MRAGGYQRTGGHHNGRQPLPCCQYHAGGQHRVQVLRGHKGQPAVEQLRQIGGVVPGQAGVHPRHAGTHTACAGNSQHRGGVAAHLHDLKVGDAEIRRLGRGGGGGAAGQISQAAGGCGHQLFRLGIHAGEKVIDVPAVFIAQRGGGRGIDQVIEVVTVTLCAGHPPGTGVGLLQQAQLCQGGHLIAQGGTGQCHVKVVCQQAGADRLAIVGIQGNNSFQDTLLAGIHGHAAHLLCCEVSILFSTLYL